MEKMPFYFKFRHFDRHENSTDVILLCQNFKENDNTFKFTKHVSTETSVIFSW